ncbi:MAG: hypothetical protein ACLQQ4_16730 [Bacteroidia bacterium]
MKNTFPPFIFFLLFSSSNVFAQKDSLVIKSSTYLSLNVATSGPISTFIQPAPSEAMGIMAYCKIDYLISENWLGIVGKFCYSENNMGNYNGDLLTAPNAPYYCGWGLAGMELNIPGKTVFFDIRFLVGAMYLNSPEVKFDSSSYSPNGWGSSGSTDVKQGKTLATAYDMGFGIMFDPNEKLTVSLNLDFYGASKNNAIEVTDVGGNYTGLTSTQWNNTTYSPVTVALLSFSFGVAYHISQ